MSTIRTIAATIAAVLFVSMILQIVVLTQAVERQKLQIREVYGRDNALLYLINKMHGGRSNALGDVQGAQPKEEPLRREGMVLSGVLGPAAAGEGPGVRPEGK